MTARLAADPALTDMVIKEISKYDLESIHSVPRGRFQRVKKRLRSVDCLLRQGNKLSEEQVKSLIGLILTSDNFREECKTIIGIDGAAEEKQSRHSHLSDALSRIGDWLFIRDPTEARQAYSDFFIHSPLSDRDFLISLAQLKADHPAFGEVIGDIFAMAHQYITNVISSALKGQLPSRLQHDINEREKMDLAARCQQLAAAEETHSWESLRDHLVQDLGARNERYVQIWIYPFSNPLTNACRPTIIIKQVRKHRSIYLYEPMSLYYLVLPFFAPL